MWIKKLLCLEMRDFSLFIINLTLVLEKFENIFGKIKEIKKSCTRPENFDNYYCVSF